MNELDRLMESPRSGTRSPGRGETVYRSNPEARTGGPSAPIPLYEEASDRAPRTYEGSGAYGSPRQYSSSNPFGPMLPPGRNPIEMPPTYPSTPMTTPSMQAGTRPERTLNWGTKPTDERSFHGHEGDPRLSGNVGFDQERYPRYAMPHPTAPMAQHAGRAPHDYGRGLAPMVEIPNELRNAVKVIVPLYSDTASSERAAAFWRSFEKCTMGMDDQLRLTAFEQCLKEKKGQEWWYNSRIHNFESLRSRFHNRFLCLTPAQTWTRLKTAARKRGESAEEWGDRLETICDALNFPEPRMRYEFFLEGIRNKQMRAVLNGNMIGSIEQACRILLFKKLHLPIEEDDEIPEDGMKPLGTKNVPSTELQVLQELQPLNRNVQKHSGTSEGYIGAVASNDPKPTSPSNGGKEKWCADAANEKGVVERRPLVRGACVIAVINLVTTPWSVAGLGERVEIDLEIVGLRSVSSVDSRVMV
ncbi:hypothetical protein PInf_009237 [Phytophthora infestans]|nr:hypothetical protein PInf_009237 [Phytophthora infestans]